MKFTTKTKAVIALIGVVLIWSVHAIISRTVVQEIPPMTLSFLRMLTASVLFLPLVLSSKPWKKNKFGSLVLISGLSVINILLFIWGVQYTSASTSQLIYAAIPVFVVLVNIFLLKEKISAGRIGGVVLGFAGLIYIVYLSAIEKGTTITGHLIGNLAVSAAMCSWLWYIILSKKMTKYFSPVEISGVSAITACIVNLFLAIIEISTTHKIGNWTPQLFLGGLYMGAFGTFLAYILYQYAIKNVSTLTVSMSQYIQPITTALLASMLIGEKLTVNFIFGSMLVLSGVFMTTTLEVYKIRK